MRSPAEMTVIQLDLTNACPRRCSHCTRFCGHHAKPLTMDFDTFKKAVDSLKDFPGIVGITGGEPTIHPAFDDFIRYYRSALGFDVDDPGSYRPQSDFLGHLIAERMDILRHNHRGLYTSLGEKYYEHFELIQDTFGVQVVNDHGHPSRHASLMATRAELGIPDEDWIGLRDECWVQKYWSAAVTSKGAFFCEVAAALDALLGGPGGWPIEPGWWKRTPAGFGDQLRWCEWCGAALPTPSRDANDEVDDVSPLWKRRLEEIRSPKALAGLVRELDMAGCVKGEYEIVDSPEPYFARERLRMAKGQAALVPKAVTAFLSPSGGSSLPAAEGRVSAGEITVFPLEDKGEDASARALARARAHDWILVLHGTAISEDLAAMLRSHVFNPGCLYHLSSHFGRAPVRALFFNVRASALRSGLDLFDPAKAYPEPRQIRVMVPASSGPWAAVGLVSRCARHAARSVLGWARYLESLWSVTMTRPDDAELLWRILLSKLGRGLSGRRLSPWRSCRRMGAGMARRGLESVPRPARRAAWAAAWLAFVLAVQVYVYRHTANGLRLDGIAREALAAFFMLAAFSLGAEYAGVRFLARPWPDRLRSCNALWFAASAAAAFLYAVGYLIRCGLGLDGLRRPLTLAIILWVAALAAFVVRGRRGRRYA